MGISFGVDFADPLSYYHQSLSSDDKEKLAEIYNELSGGRSDGIGARELAEAVQNANVTFGGMSLQAATAALMRQGDANGDGKIGQEEFLDAMQYVCNNTLPRRHSAS